MADDRYEFTEDWFTWQSNIWTELFRALDFQPSTILEIGSYEGRSTCWFADHLLSKAGSTLHAIDLHDNSVRAERFRRNLRATGKSGQITVHTGRSADVLRELKSKFDLVYIDGSHEASDVLTDSCFCWQILNAGGLLIFDDYLWDQPEEYVTAPPKPAIDAFLLAFNDQLKVLHNEYQMIVRKNGDTRT